MRKSFPSIFVLFLISSTVAAAQRVHTTYNPENDRTVSSWLDQNLSKLVSTYKRLHANPELSLHETKTAALLADELSRSGYHVTSRVGGTGVVGVLKNGSGPTLLIRGDLDALPVTEETGLEYASKVKVKHSDSTAGVMHACGHDVHTTMLLGTAQFLSEMRDRWQGTLLIIGQPAEELSKGAKMMIEDGLLERFPKPDYCIALHVKHDLPVGQIGYTSGWAFANVDSVDIIIYGRSGHGARPHQAVDPIITAAHLITNLQTLVSRRVDPVKPAVVTVGSIHGGSKHNIIPNEVKLQLTVRSYCEEVRRQLLDGIRQIAVDTCRTFNCPKPPTVTVLDEFTPAAYNDPELTAAAVDLFQKVFGEDNVIELPAEMGGEDFGCFARILKVPGLQFRVGTISREAYQASLQPGGPSLPSIHSSKFAPLPEETLRTCVRTMSNLALALLKRK